MINQPYSGIPSEIEVIIIKTQYGFPRPFFGGPHYVGYPQSKFAAFVGAAEL